MSTTKTPTAQREYPEGATFDFISDKEEQQYFTRLAYEHRITNLNDAF